jgi:site-specific DNA recombinase
MRYQKWGKNGHKLVCYSQQKTKPYLVKDPGCDNLRPWADEVESAVMTSLFKFAVEAADPGKSKGSAENALNALARQAKTLSEQIKRLYSLYAEDGDSLLLETINEKQKELRRVNSMESKERERGAASARAKKTLSKIENLADVWDCMTAKEKQDVVRWCITRVEIADENISVHYKLL